MFCMTIRMNGIENGFVSAINNQLTSQADRFMLGIHVNFVIWITKISNFFTGQIVCGITYEYSCVELGKILVLCKKRLRA